MRALKYLFLATLAMWIGTFLFKTVTIACVGISVILLRVILGRGLPAADRRDAGLSLAALALGWTFALVENRYETVTHAGIGVLSERYRVLPETAAGRPELDSDTVEVIREVFTGERNPAFWAQNYGSSRPTRVEISQTGDEVTASFVIARPGPSYRVHELGEALIRLLKGWNGGETPVGDTLGASALDYRLEIRDGDGKLIAKGEKPRRSPVIVWTEVP